MDDAFGKQKSAASGSGGAGSRKKVGSEASEGPLVAKDLRVWDRGTSSHADAAVLDAIAVKLLDVYTRHRAEVDGLAAENEQLRGLVPGYGPRPIAVGPRPETVAAATFVDLMTQVWDAVRDARNRSLRKRLALVTDRLRAVDKDKRDLLDAVHRNRPNRPAATETADSLRAALDRERRKNEHLQSVVDDMFAAHNDHDDQP